jgi:hypothetical protein
LFCSAFLSIPIPSFGVVLTTNSARLAALFVRTKSWLVLTGICSSDGNTRTNKRCEDISSVIFSFHDEIPAFCAKCGSVCVGSLALLLLPHMTANLMAPDVPTTPTSSDTICILSAIDDPHKVVKVIASDGKSGDTREISYSNCKVIGNGSFGVVFQAKLVGGPKEGEDIAIKKVLQDKRFKVRCGYFLRYVRDSDCVSDLASKFCL